MQTLDPTADFSESESLGVGKTICVSVILMCAPEPWE